MAASQVTKVYKFNMQAGMTNQNGLVLPAATYGSVRHQTLKKKAVNRIFFWANPSFYLGTSNFVTFCL